MNRLRAVTNLGARILQRATDLADLVGRPEMPSKVNAQQRLTEFGASHGVGFPAWSGRREVGTPGEEPGREQGFP